MKTNNLVIILLFCIVLRTISAFPLDNILMPGGADASSHLFKTWYIAEKGLSNWNEYWYGGHQFLKFYPPLFYIISGYLGKIIGYLLAYKIVIDFFYISMPVVFYYFLDEFNLPEKQKIISLIIFSLMPLYHYYLSDGRHPALISLFFGIIAWKFLKRGIEFDKWNKNLVISTFFLSLSLLSHSLVGFFVASCMFVWALTYSLNYKTFIKIIKIILLCSLLTLWWIVPFFLESWDTIESQQHNDLRIIENEFTTEKINTYLSFMSTFYSNNFSEIIIFSFLFFTGILCLFSFHKTDKNVLSFFVVIIFIIFLILLIRYKRSLMLIPIPMSILASQGLMFFKRKVNVSLIFLLVFLAFLSYFSLRTDFFKIPDVPNVSKDGRVMYLQSVLQSKNEVKGSYSSLVGPVHDQEIISGSYPQAINSEKRKYDSALNDPLKIDQNEYYTLLKNGYVNYIIIDKENNDFIEYFNSSKIFMVENITTDFIVFEVKPKSTYVEINNKSVISSVLKDKDKIEINFKCESGKISIKESCNKFWNGYVNGEKIDLSCNKNGFIETSIKETGYCSFSLKFVEPRFYFIFKLIFLLGLIYVFIEIIKNR